MVFDWICNWRLNVCLWGSLILAAVAANSIPYEPWRWIVAGILVTVGVIIGFLWDSPK